VLPRPPGGIKGPYSKGRDWCREGKGTRGRRKQGTRVSAVKRRCKNLGF